MVSTPLCGGNVAEGQVRRWLVEEAEKSEEKDYRL